MGHLLEWQAHQVVQHHDLPLPERKRPQRLVESSSSGLSSGTTGGGPSRHSTTARRFNRLAATTARFSAMASVVRSTTNIPLGPIRFHLRTANAGTAGHWRRLALSGRMWLVNGRKRER